MTGRDPVVAQALRELPVPEHGPGFWEELEQRLAAADDGPSAVEPPDLRVATGELPALPLVQLEPTVPRRHRVGFLAAAAAIAVVALAAGIVVRGDGDAPPVEQAAPTTAVPDPPEPPVPAADALAVPMDMKTPTGAVLTWIGALGRGDPATAAALLGPRTLRYLAALGADPVGFMVESEEGYGSWAAASDLKVSEIGVIDAGVVVVLEGTAPREGEDTWVRLDAIPTAQTATGQWLVEPVALDPTHGGRLEPIAPAPLIEDGWAPVVPDAVIEFSSLDPDASYWYSLDGDPSEPSRTGAWDPPGELDPGEHTLVAIAVGPNLFTAVAGTLVVRA